MYVYAEEKDARMTCEESTYTDLYIFHLRKNNLIYMNENPNTYQMQKKLVVRLVPLSFQSLLANQSHAGDLMPVSLTV